MTRTVTARSTYRPRVQSLESRRLLAVAALTAELYADEAGTPGELIGNFQVGAGQTFFLKINAQEFDRRHIGLQSVAVDIHWDASLLEVVEENFDLATVITPELPMWQSGELDSAAGEIRDLAATSASAIGAGRAIGDGTPETFALIRMRAGEQLGESTIELSKADSKTILFPVSVLGERHLRFGSIPLTILPAVEPVIDASAPETDLSETIEVAADPPPIDQAVSFDANGDGVFDLADLGWINVMGSAPAPVSQSPAEAPVEPTAEALASHTCFAFPELGSIAAAESWLDAFARAWLNDEQLRARRRTS